MPRPPSLAHTALGGRANSGGAAALLVGIIRPWLICSQTFGAYARWPKVFGPGSAALSMRKVAQRALEHDDEESPRESDTRGA
jgi:hypothetical protein